MVVDLLKRDDVVTDYAQGCYVFRQTSTGRLPQYRIRKKKQKSEDDALQECMANSYNVLQYLLRERNVLAKRADAAVDDWPHRVPPIADTPMEVQQTNIKRRKEGGEKKKSKQKKDEYYCYSWDENDIATWTKYSKVLEKFSLATIFERVFLAGVWHSISAQQDTPFQSFPVQPIWKKANVLQLLERLFGIPSDPHLSAEDFARRLSDRPLDRITTLDLDGIPVLSATPRPIGKNKFGELYKLAALYFLMADGNGCPDRFVNSETEWRFFIDRRVIDGVPATVPLAGYKRALVRLTGGKTPADMLSKYEGTVRGLAALLTVRDGRYLPKDEFRGRNGSIFLGVENGICVLSWTNLVTPPLPSMYVKNKKIREGLLGENGVLPRTVAQALADQSSVPLSRVLYIYGNGGDDDDFEKIADWSSYFGLEEEDMEDPSRKSVPFFEISALARTVRKARRKIEFSDVDKFLNLGNDVFWDRLKSSFVTEDDDAEPITDRLRKNRAYAKLCGKPGGLTLADIESVYAEKDQVLERLPFLPGRDRLFHVRDGLRWISSSSSSPITDLTRDLSVIARDAVLRDTAPLDRLFTEDTVYHLKTPTPDRTSIFTRNRDDFLLLEYEGDRQPRVLNLANDENIEEFLKEHGAALMMWHRDFIQEYIRYAITTKPEGLEWARKNYGLLNPLFDTSWDTDGEFIFVDVEGEKNEKVVRTLFLEGFCRPGRCKNLARVMSTVAKMHEESGGQLCCIDGNVVVFIFGLSTGDEVYAALLTRQLATAKLLLSTRRGKPLAMFDNTLPERYLSDPVRAVLTGGGGDATQIMRFIHDVVLLALRSPVPRWILPEFRFDSTAGYPPFRYSEYPHHTIASGISPAMLASVQSRKKSNHTANASSRDKQRLDKTS